MSAAELLTWHPADATKPDSDITVLCWDGETPFFTGYWDSYTEQWIDCPTSAEVFDVTHWAEPNGPQP
jgi:hypothetical protein